jgi:uncharacterized protein YndB with AHSA1/START domain
MEKSLTVEESITIQATPAKVWEVLTSPEYTKQYMMGCVAESDWKPGSPLLWTLEHEGTKILCVKGDIVQAKEPEYLEYTVIAPGMEGVPDLPENYLTVKLTLTPENGGTRLHVWTGDFAKVAKGDVRYQHTVSDGGWMVTLIKIKTAAENQ